MQNRERTTAAQRLRARWRDDAAASPPRVRVEVHGNGPARPKDGRLHTDPMPSVRPADTVRPRQHETADAAGSAVVTLRDVHLKYGEGENAVAALRGVSLEVAAGELLAITGQSGSGKTTLLNVVAGLQRPGCGRVRVGEIDVESAPDAVLARMRRREVAYVFQFFNLLGQLSARENVGIVLEADGVRAREVAERVEHALDVVGMRHRGCHLPSELSGGEMQRIAIARALACDARVILADEPTGNLDSKSGAAMLALLRDLVDRERRTVVLVTHDAKAAACGDREIRMADGKILEP